MIGTKFVILTGIVNIVTIAVIILIAFEIRIIVMFWIGILLHLIRSGWVKVRMLYRSLLRIYGPKRHAIYIPM